MKKSVVKLFKVGLVLLAAFAVLTLTSCSGLFINNTGTVSFVLDNEILNAARDGDEPHPGILIEVSLEDNKGWGVKQTVKIPEYVFWESMESDRRFERSFNNIPVGKKLYAQIKIFNEMNMTVSTALADPEFYGKSDYFTVRAGNNEVSIKAGFYRNMVPYTYNDTPIVTYDFISGEYYYNVGGESFNVSSSSFCFDCNGNFYTLNEGSNYYSYIVSSRYDFPADIEIYSYYSPCLLVDTETNIMYSYYINDKSIYIKKFPELISSGIVPDNPDYDQFSSFTVTVNSNQCQMTPYLCTIHNGIVYVITKDETPNRLGYYLFSFSFENSSDISAGKKIEFPEGDILLSDMIYMDGAVYFLLYNNANCFNQSCTMAPYGYFSRGALVKYDVSDESIKTLGWTSNPLNNSGKYIYIKADYGLDQDILYDDYNCTVLSKVCADNIAGKMIGGKQILFPSFYVPSGKNNTKQFYGPKRFIGIKPKKLLIADDGTAFYTDSDNVYRMKNVNRIVSVDLEKFAITSAENTSSTFTSEMTNTLNTSAFGNVETILEEGKTYYLSVGVPYSPNNQYDQLYAYFPLVR